MPLFAQREEQPRAEPTRMAQVAEPVAFAPPAAEPMAPAAARRPAAAAADYVLPIDSLNAVADSAGLQWVNSDAEKIRAAQEAMAAMPAPIHVPREIRKVELADEGPLVLVETARTCRRSACRSRTRRPTPERPGRPRLGPARRLRKQRRAVSFQGRRSSARWYAGRVHQLVPGDRRGLRQQVEAARFARRVGLPVAVGRGPQQAVEQLVDRGAAVERLVAQQHHVAAGRERERRRLGVADLDAADAARAGHAQVVAEDRAVEAELQAQDLLQPARREAGRVGVDLRDRPRAPASRSRASRRSHS